MTDAVLASPRPASGRWQARLWLAQRLSAAVLAVCVLVHLATMIVAVQQGLSAASMLARTRGSAFWPLFYGLFVLAVAIHAPLGLRAILAEWAGFRGRGADALLALLAVLLAVGGGIAVYAMTGAR